MNSMQFKATQDEEDYLYAAQLTSSFVLPMVLRTAIGLNLFETIARAGDGAQLSPSEIASFLSTKNPDAPIMLDRILSLLVTHSVLTCSMVTRDNGDVERLYGLAPVCKYFVPDNDGVSVSSWPQFGMNPSVMQSWTGLKDAILEGGTPFKKVHGESVFELLGRDPELNGFFNKAMSNATIIIMRMVLKKYKGFENLKEIVDVGGGLGVTSSIIASNYPGIKCINFDLPHVIQHAKSYPGVEHVEGNMFVSVPKGETILLKAVLHNWGDEDCLVILKNCYEALPGHGKLIVTETFAVAGVPERNSISISACDMDVMMMTYCGEGKERTEKELGLLAKEAGFGDMRPICCSCNVWVIEFYKNP